MSHWHRIESPSNPLLGVADLPALIAAGHKAGAIVAVDTTFTTPILQRPLQLGADITMHSATKFIGGHSDLLMGALVASDKALAQVLLHALVCWLPLKTFALSRIRTCNWTLTARFDFFL